ncbi:MAG: hypothetical protein HC788_13845 [Sphingopyxis sp.]|nr:hypothetical protein [Sphingopyxis sp.]
MSAVILIAVTTGAVALMDQIGFLPAAFIMCACAAHLFGAAPLTAVGIGAAQAAFWFLLFKYALGTYLHPAHGSFPAEVLMSLDYLWTGFAVAVAFMTATAIIMWIFPRPLIGLFVDASAPGGAEVMRLAVTFLAVAAIFQIVDGAQVAGAGMLRGLHDTTVPMIIALFGYWGIGIGVGAWLAFRVGWDGVGIWTGLAVGLGIVAVLMVIRWTMRDRLGLVPLTSE